MSSDQRAANMQKRWNPLEGGFANFGVMTLDEEKELDPDSCGSRGAEETASTSFPINDADSGKD